MGISSYSCLADSVGRSVAVEFVSMCSFTKPEGSKVKDFKVVRTLAWLTHTVRSLGTNRRQDCYCLNRVTGPALSGLPLDRPYQQ
jgi:hypothetical protein